MKEALSTASIPLSPNYFDALSEEEEREGEQRERGAPRGKERPRELTPEHQEPQPAPTRDLRGKAQMSLTDQAAEKEESDLQLALHLSRVEAQK